MDHWSVAEPGAPSRALAALNPKLLIVDLILAGSQRPRAMFVCFLLGGMGLGLTVGLLDVPV